ncbi:MAG: SLBB domain-containing protein, partial [Bdellovibrionales bacterium]
KLKKHTFSRTFALLFSTTLLNTHAYAQESTYIGYTPWTEEQNAQNTLPTKQQKEPREQPANAVTYIQDTKQEEPAPSRIEDFYATRIVDELSQYGYDLFQNKTIRPIDSPSGGVNQDSIIIGVGDTLDIILRGQINDRQDYTISPQGLLILDQFPPISVIGLSLKQLQDRLTRESESLINTDIFVSLKTVRQVGVTVAGHVEEPGRHLLTATHTIMDALQMAGGIKKTGSLRQIKLNRNGQTKIIDLYGLLQNGSSRADEPLREGDKIIVPAIGSTLAIAGDVKNPAIYEIPKGQQYSLATLFALSGGLISPSEYRFIKLGINEHGQEITQDVKDLGTRQFGDGSILVVSRRKQSRKGAIEIEGASNTTGLHDIQKTKSLSDLLPDRASFDNNIYPLIGLIERWNEKTLAPEYISFSPLQIVNKENNTQLQQNDKVHLFSRKDITELTNEETRDNKAPSDEKEDPKQQILNTILKEHAVYIRGAVRQEGVYPIHQSTNITDILSIAGGYTLDADTEKIEVTENRDGNIYRQNVALSSLPESPLKLEPGDTIRVNTKTKTFIENSVHLYGEVKSPGRYDLMPGDTLLSLLERAGGLSDHAYPQGTIFSRKSERKREENRFKAQAQDLELRLATILEDSEKPDKEQINNTQALISELKNAKAIGRITVESDPETLITKPELNILLENGDKVYIPKRPLTVRVAGEVLSPSALQFRSEKDPSEYISEAGGFSYHADKGRTFVIFPDGSAQPLRVNYWNHQANFIPPGSTIIVPRDPKPFNLVDSAKDISQIVANLAVTAVLADEIGDDD